ncbi:DNA cytosine methyltransferase [Polaribacter sp.]|nr:DNA cytosine methyltransferase [Polaribacter sp.]
MWKSDELSIEELDSKNFTSNNTTAPTEKQAILTHYLQHSKGEVGPHYKKDALAVLDDYLNFKKEVSLNQKETIKHLSAKINTIPFPTSTQTNFNFIDLFAGIGGFRLAMQNIGGKCVFTSEWDKNAKKTYFKNYGEVPFGDITLQEVKDYIPEKFDILCGGFPCQAFSIAGYQKGFSETRGTLFFDIERIVEKHRPKVVFLENVKNLVSHDKGNTFKTIVKTLEQKLGYKVATKVLNSMKHANVPQNRERIFIIAFDPKQVKNYDNFKFPNEIELTKTIADFIDCQKQDDKYYYAKTHQYYPELEKTVTKRDTVYQWRRVYVRENKSNVCPTLTANMGSGGHNVPIIKDDFGIRKLTPKECFAFQGYPMEKFVLPPIANGKLYMQAGNSVTTPLIERIGREILKVL